MRFQPTAVDDGFEGMNCCSVTTFIEVAFDAITSPRMKRTGRKISKHVLHAIRRFWMT
jgi:hypothetical protein